MSFRGTTVAGIIAGTNITVTSADGVATINAPGYGPTGSVADVAQTNSGGNAATIARGDHSHQGVTSLAAGDSSMAVTGGDNNGHGALGVAVSAAVAKVQENINTIAASGAAVAIPDVTVATINLVTLTANCTLTFPAAGAGKSFLLGLTQDATGSRTATWPAAVAWAGGTAPTLTTTPGDMDLLSFICLDGTHWSGVVVAQAFTSP